MNMKKVEMENRMTFLPKYFGRNMMTVENTVYAMMQQKVGEYNGGLWDFYEVEAEGATVPLMVWNTDCATVMLRGGYQEDKVRPLVASFAILMMSYNHLSWHFAEKDREFAVKLDGMYYKLRDFLYEDEENGDKIFTPEEKSIIYSFLD